MSSRAARNGRRKDFMKAFTIDQDNNITAFASAKQIGGVPKGTEVFCTSEELCGLIDHWPGGRLLDVWNGIPGVSPVKRFTSRSTAAVRIWKAIQSLEPEEAEQSPKKNPAAAS